MGREGLPLVRTRRIGLAHRSWAGPQLSPKPRRRPCGHAAAKLGARHSLGSFCWAWGRWALGTWGESPDGQLDGGLFFGRSDSGQLGVLGRRERNRTMTPLSKIPALEIISRSMVTNPQPGLSRKPVPSRGQARPASFRDPSAGQCCHKPASQQSTGAGPGWTGPGVSRYSSGGRCFLDPAACPGVVTSTRAMQPA